MAKNAARGVTKWLKKRKLKLARDVIDKTTRLETTAAKKRGKARKKALSKRS